MFSIIVELVYWYVINIVFLLFVIFLFLNNFFVIIEVIFELVNEDINVIFVILGILSRGLSNGLNIFDVVFIFFIDLIIFIRFIVK